MKVLLVTDDHPDGIIVDSEDVPAIVAKRAESKRVAGEVVQSETRRTGGCCDPSTKLDDGPTVMVSPPTEHRRVKRLPQAPR